MKLTNSLSIKIDSVAEKKSISLWYVIFHENINKYSLCEDINVLNCCKPACNRCNAFGLAACKPLHQRSYGHIGSIMPSCGLLHKHHNDHFNDDAVP